jgi:hypothetical protein
LAGSHVIEVTITIISVIFAKFHLEVKQKLEEGQWTLKIQKKEQEIFAKLCTSSTIGKVIL